MTRLLTEKPKFDDIVGRHRSKHGSDVQNRIVIKDHRPHWVRHVLADDYAMFQERADEIILVHLIDAVHQCDFMCDEHLELFVVAICDCCEVVDLHTCRMGDPF